ncbi:copper resistance system multicopper oxidase [Sphingobium sp. SCG-1]|uniref:copper resistance system multicopper oxidase n=1 Tax=Sphingobium sp. SCG-1 TaxID=2072936 RepID=UPI000CD6B6E6|nr:copper resistance system multicopper oxidase [Sphingobium sp. SCG-1]AUW59780.1 copper resistance system multicopper oxidase [Sphingobium sp. SCG-1]
MFSARVDRRSILRGASGLGLLSSAEALFPAWARGGTAGVGQGGDVLSGDSIHIDIGHSRIVIGEREAHAVTANGTMPGPMIRLKEGQQVRLSVANGLDEDTSIHWHGLIVPFQYDGVPGISFPGIKPGRVFDYVFPIRQSGTYWYHSHSNMQEAMGLFGPLIIDPAGEEPAPYDREHVILLSDWSNVHPHSLLRRLKQMGGYYNRQKQTLAGLIAGRDQKLSERIEWGKMRMDPTDISDVTGSTYSYLINGHDSAGNWTGLFTPGERVRLRFINASAMTNFNVRLAGTPMTVVQADGQDVDPVETDEFQIGIAETYDVIVRPEKAEAIAIIAEAIDRSGLARATLAPRIGMVAPMVPLRQRPLLGMKDMGMDMSGMDMSNGTLDLSAPIDAPATADSHSGMKMRDKSLAPPSVRMGPGVATISAAPADRLGDRPTGLENVDHRVLTYADLKALVSGSDRRVPSRELEVHLTANMERYMWSFDGVKLSENPEPLAFRHNERVRVTLINDTMMPHPIHLHGHFFELVNGAGDKQPRKHTVNVLPGGKASFDLTADALGDWAFHCHMLLHMHAGMFRVVTVRAEETAE